MYICEYKYVSTCILVSWLRGGSKGKRCCRRRTAIPLPNKLLPPVNEYVYQLTFSRSPGGKVSGLK